MRRRIMTSGIAVVLLAAPARGQEADEAFTLPAVFESDGMEVRVEEVTSGLGIPLGLAFLPDGRGILTERATARMSLIDLSTGTVTPLAGLPEIAMEGEIGLHDVAVHPSYAENGWIYFAYAVQVDTATAVAVDRARLRGSRLEDLERLFLGAPGHREAAHYGARLVLADGFLFVTLGDRRDRSGPQNLGAYNGKIIRLHDDGTVPSDNPFVHVSGALPEVWTYGHRNPQGLALHPETGVLWSIEHGPRGGDEINLVASGRNYGWPVVTHGEEYGGGPVGAGITHHAGMEPPRYYYRPSIAPSGAEFYSGDALPAWRGDLFTGGLAIRHLNRLVIEGDRVLREDQLLEEAGWRVRLVRHGPDGFLYLGTDSGLLVRLRPDS